MDPNTQQPGVVSPEVNMRIPDHFIKAGCMACTFANCDFPNCWGAKASGTCICLEGYGACCKVLDNDPKACFLCWSGDSECITPGGLCKCYEQFFCLECFCAIPSVEDGYKATPIARMAMPNRDGVSGANDAVVFSALCCIIESCFCKFPDCLGCYRKEVCLCVEAELILYKFLCCEPNKEKPDTCCILAKGNVLLVMPYTCCKGVNQICCLDGRCACPCDDDVPCAWGYLPFCLCCVNGQCHCGCCMTINDILRLKNGGQLPGGGYDPNQQQQGGYPVQTQPGQPQYATPVSNVVIADNKA